MDKLETYRMLNQAIMNRREQIDHVSSAILKLDMLGLTPYNGMVKCPPPDGVHPFRWKAMVINCFNNKGKV